MVHHTTRTYGDVEMYLHTLLSSVGDLPHTTMPALPPWEGGVGGVPPYPLHRIWSGCGGGEKNISSCQEVEPYFCSMKLSCYINRAVPAARELKYSI